MTTADQHPLPRSAPYRGGSGEPMVLLHGATSSWHCWDALLPTLTGHYDVLAPNLPGHGGVPGLDPLTVDGMLDAVEKTMDEAGFGTAHLVGNSLGGWVAMELARRGRGRSVVTLSPAGGWTTAETRVPNIFRSMRRQLQLSRFALPLALRVPALRRAALHLVCEHGDRLSSEAAIGAARDALVCTLIDNLPDPVFAQTEPSGDPSIPMLLAWGEHDRLLPIPRYSDPWRRLVPTATWRVLPDVGHVPMFDDPVMVSDLILDWVARASATREAS